MYFEEFEIGKRYEHHPGRTVTAADNMLFTTLSMNPQPLHIDFHMAAETEFGQPLVNSIFTLGLMIGMSVSDTTLGTTIGNLGMSEVNFPHPVFHGDTLHSRTTVRSKRESKSRPNDGIVVFYHEALNQDGVIVANCLRTALMRKQPEQVAAK
jgi:acyl dehydratase